MCDFINLSYTRQTFNIPPQQRTRTFKYCNYRVKKLKCNNYWLTFMMDNPSDIRQAKHGMA
jgi:hypothetical protein